MLLFETIFLRFVFYFTNIYLVCYSNLTTALNSEPQFTGLGEWRLFLKTENVDREDQTSKHKIMMAKFKDRQGHAVFPLTNNWISFPMVAALFIVNFKWFHQKIKVSSTFFNFSSTKSFRVSKFSAFWAGFDERALFAQKHNLRPHFCQKLMRKCRDDHIFPFCVI